MDSGINRRDFIGAGVGLATTATAGAQPIGTSGQPRRGGTLTVHMPQEQRILNPAIRASTGIYVITSKIMESLVDVNEKGEIEPMLATSWDSSVDGRTITVKLRGGVKWHDGRSFSSADVQYTAMELWKKHLNFGSALHSALEAVDTPDRLTAVFRYGRPMPLGLFLGAAPDLGYIAPRHIFEGTDVIANPANLAPIGTGPFKFVQYERGQYVVAERNPDYWKKGLPYLDRIVWRFIPDKSAATAALEAGQVHMSNYSALPLSDLDRLKKDPRFEVSSKGNERQSFQNTIEFNTRSKYISDVRVRQAIISALDVDFFVKNFLYGNGRRANGPIPQSSSFYTPGMPDYPFDQKRANEVLDEAGYKRGADGTRFTIKLLSAPFGDDIPLWSIFIQQSLQPIGVKVVIEKPDSATYLTQVYRDWNFDVSTSWHVYRSDPAISTMVWYRSGSPKGTISTNQWGWVNPSVDKMIDDAASTIDPSQRKALYADIVRQLNTETPLWMAIDRQFVSVTSRRVHNHHNNPRWPSSHWADLWMDA